ncbi:MAG: hypothetical protein CL549_05510 [Alcanivorax sp.]|nr:hypothetical protein [Alcanivorax sp.]MAY09942.1 hypothetical protein [Alcanivorax sp.]MBI53125.1 hypothetical protein [Alcanivorax sp.]HCE39876.1 hypothetical protein [Alcanivorax sp.]
MNEAQRQSYLRALGLTPWVARTPLPGAAPSETLDWDAETDGQPAPVADAVPASVVPRPAPAPSAPPGEEPSAGGEGREPSAGGKEPSAVVEGKKPSAKGEGKEPSAGGREPSARGEQPSRPVQEPPPGQASPPREEARVAETQEAFTEGGGRADVLVFTLEVHLAGDTWVVFQQEDPSAPELGRHAGTLAGSLLAVFGAGRERPRRFYCPLAGQPTGAGEAAQALRAFVAGLARRQGGERVLMCLDDNLAGALFEQPRYQPFQLGDLPALVVSSLEEMLAEPVRHKRDSWRAMVTEGFDGRG